MSSDGWLLFPLFIIVLMTGTNPLTPVPLLMMLMMTNTLTQLLPNPIPILDYNVLELSGPASAQTDQQRQAQRSSSSAGSVQLHKAEVKSVARTPCPMHLTEPSTARLRPPS